MGPFLLPVLGDGVLYRPRPVEDHDVCVGDVPAQSCSDLLHVLLSLLLNPGVVCRHGGVVLEEGCHIVIELSVDIRRLPA